MLLIEKYEVFARGLSSLLISTFFLFLSTCFQMTCSRICVKLGIVQTHHIPHQQCVGVWRGEGKLRATGIATLTISSRKMV